MWDKPDPRLEVKRRLITFLGASEAIAPLVESSQERGGGGGDTCFDKFFGTLITGVNISSSCPEFVLGIVW